MAKLSVVIPLYNKAPHIEKTIQSVLRQSSMPDEIIVVDDGSTDGGWQIVEKYSQQGVRLVRQENSGVSAARNLGASVASGDYIAFLDADDWWLPNHVEILRMLIDKYPEASLLSTAFIIERNGTRYRPKSFYKDGWTGLVDDFFRVYGKNFALINSSTACVKKPDFIRSGCFPLGVKRGEDIICWIKMSLEHKVAHAEVVTSVYFQDATNRTNLLKENKPPESLIHMARLLKSDLVDENKKTGLRKLLCRIAFFTAAGLRLQGDYRGVEEIRKLLFAAGCYLTSAFVFIVRITPLFFIDQAKKYRHPKVDV